MPVAGAVIFPDVPGMDSRSPASSFHPQAGKNLIQNNAGTSLGKE